METAREDVISIIYQAIDRLSEFSPVTIEKSPDSELTKSLDSLGFINLLAMIEELAEKQLGKTVGVSRLTEESNENRSMTIDDLADEVIRSLR